MEYNSRQSGGQLHAASVTLHNIPGKRFIQHIKPDKNTLHGTIYRTERHYTAQYTGQNGITHHAIPDKKALNSTIYRTKGITHHAIPDKKALHSSIYLTKRHYSSRYTGQKGITQLNIPDKTALLITL
jgi:hypothetical protein